MKRFTVEWSCINWVKPKIDQWACPDEDERKRREEPAQTSCGGWLTMAAPTKHDAIARFLSINGTRHAVMSVTEA